MTSPFIVAEHVCIVRAKQTLLHDVSFTLEAGQVLALLGANGAGKSTLLAALAGESALTSGIIALDGKALSDYTSASLAEVRAFNAVEPPLAFALSVFDFVALGRPFADANESAIAQALEQCHATQWIARDAASLSSGELLRVQLARSLYQLGDAPRCLWLLDEPFAHLDLAQRQFALRLLRHVATVRQWAIVFSTHEPRDASAMADKALLLRSGGVIAEGGVQVALQGDYLRACYGTAVAMNSGQFSLEV